MANTLNKQTILDGSRNLTVNIHIEGDGSGDETDTVLIDASAYSPAFTNCRLVGFHGLLYGFTAELKWDATTDVPFLNIPDYEVNYTRDEVDHFGGVPNSAGTGRTGNILISTSGLGASEHGTLILELIKKAA